MMKTRKISILMMAILFTGVFFTSCKNDDDVTPEPVNEEEEITRVSLIVEGNGASKTYDYKVDGTKKDKIMLDANSTYTVKFEVYNDEENENVTEEVKEEKEEHLVCFSPSNSSLRIVRSDKDDNGKEIGLSSTWTTLDNSTGKVQVKLKHQPDIKATQSENCNAGGTDVDVSFDFEIKSK